MRYVRSRLQKSVTEIQIKWWRRGTSGVWTRHRLRQTLECYCAKFSGFLRPDTGERPVIMFKRARVSPEKLLNPLRSTWSADRDQWHWSSDPTRAPNSFRDSACEWQRRTTTTRKIQLIYTELMWWWCSTKTHTQTLMFCVKVKALQTKMAEVSKRNISEVFRVTWTCFSWFGPRDENVNDAPFHLLQ